MNKPLTEWRKRINEILADGEWHDREEVVQDAMRLVPPGVAFRRGEYYRVKALRKQYGKEAAQERARQKGDDRDAILAGKRALVAEALQGSLASGAIEKRKDKSGYMIRQVVKPARDQFSAEADLLVHELVRQLEYWNKAELYLPKGDVGDALLGGDPRRSIRDTLERVGRKP